MFMSLTNLYSARQWGRRGLIDSIPMLALFVSFVLICICAFSGTKTTPNQAMMLRIDTSAFSMPNVTNTKPPSPSSSTTKTITPTGKNGVQIGAAKVTRNVKSDLKIKDFYSIHMLNACSYKSKAGKKPSDIECTTQKAFFYLDPMKVLSPSESDFANKFEELGWPKFVEKIIHKTEFATRVMFTFYCMALGAIIMAIATALISVFASGRTFSLIRNVCTAVAMFTLFIASSVSNAIIFVMYCLINAGGNILSIKAQVGTQFVTLTWVATALVMFAGIVWAAISIRDRRSFKKNGGYPTEEE